VAAAVADFRVVALAAVAAERSENCQYRRNCQDWKISPGNNILD
jgi:hypothetical protein